MWGNWYGLSSRPLLKGLFWTAFVIYTVHPAVSTQMSQGLGSHRLQLSFILSTHTSHLLWLTLFIESCSQCHSMTTHFFLYHLHLILHHTTLWELPFTPAHTYYTHYSSFGVQSHLSKKTLTLIAATYTSLKWCSTWVYESTSIVGFFLF